MMRPYPAYRDSGVEWLGEVPEGWEVKRLRFAVSLNPSKSEVAGLDPNTLVTFVPMEAVGENGELDTSQVRAISEVSSGYTYLRDGDVAFAKITPCFENGKRALMRGLLKGVAFGTTELTVLRPRAALTTPEFLFWVLSSPFFRRIGEAHMYGAGGQKRVPDDFVRDFPVPLPPLPEQTAIAAFLDRETAKIDALVAEQRRLIALLREKRQAVISHAVTRGLNPQAPLKPSGIDWLGDVPESWGLVQLRRVVDPRRRVTYGIVQPGPPDPDGRFMVRGQDYSFGWVTADQIFRVSAAVEEPYRRARLKPGDLVMTIVGAGTGKTEIVPDFLDGANITQTTARIAPDGELVSSEYLRFVLSSEVGRVQVALFQKGAAQPGLNLEYVTAFRIPLPPRPEQDAIVAFLADRSAVFAPLIEEAETAIALLQERRAALISAAVTGKIDVRDLAESATEAA